jgi:hypothetical protein
MRRAGEVVTHLRDHAQDVIARGHGLLIADLSEAAGGDRLWLGQGCERLGRLAGRSSRVSWMKTGP